MSTLVASLATGLGARALGRRHGAALAAAAVALLVMAPLALAAASPVAADRGATGAIVPVAGVAVDHAGRALPGVEVRVATLGDAERPAVVVASTRSDVRGRFGFLTLPVGTYRLVAVKSGYVVAVQTVSTIVRDTLRLVLHPAGEPGAPGEKPADERWALALPARDRLEDRTAGMSGGIATAADSTQLGPQWQVAVAASRRSADQSAADGLDFGATGRWDGGPAGRWDADLKYASDRGSGALRDDDQAVRLAWTPPKLGAGQWRAEALLARSDRERGLADVPGVWSSTLERGTLRGEHLLRQGDLVLDAALELRFVAGREQADFTARQLATSLRVERPLGEAHSLTADMTLRGTTGAWQPLAGAAPGPDVALVVLAEDRDGSRRLSTLRSGFNVGVADRWGLTPNLALYSRVQVDQVTEDRSRIVGAGTVGTVWSIAPELELRAEAGAATSDRGGAVALVALAGGNTVWNWTVCVAQDGGTTTWRGRSASPLDPEPLLLGARAASRRAGVSFGVHPGPRVASMTLSAAVFSAEGEMAPYVPGDLALVPVAEDGSADGRTLAVQASLGSLGTVVSVSWQELRDRQLQGGILDGGTWSKRQIAVRQPVGSRDWLGGSLTLVVSVESSALSVAPTPSRAAPARFALLELSRVIGGVALSF